MIRIITGHNNLNYFQSKLDTDRDPLCRLCEEEDETFDHWVQDCPVLRQQRCKIFEVATNNYSIIPNEWDIEKVLEFSYIPTLNNIIEKGESLNESVISTGRSYALEPD